MKSPQQVARNILRNAGITDLRGLSLEDFIQWHPNCYLDMIPMHGSQGRIQFLKSTALITINSNIKNKGQKRFAMAHEFGHFNLHFGLQPVYSCDEESFKQWLASGGQEQEANEFAAELLIPKKALTNECQNVDFSIDLIKHVADTFETSQTATAIRIVEDGLYPIALVYSEQGIVKWTVIHSSFPLKFIVKNALTPQGSAARHYFNTGISKSKAIKSDIWFFCDNKVLMFSKYKLRETLLPIPYYEGVLSFLSFD